MLILAFGRLNDYFLMSIFYSKKGFTLVETIIYIAVFSVFFWVVLGFFWQLQQADIKAKISREVKENTAQVGELFKYIVRDAESVDIGSSQFGAHFGVLELVYSDGNRIFDTYTTSIIAGGQTMDIHKLRYTENGQFSDVTSDHVDVTQFQLSDFTQGDAPHVIQMEFTLKTVNPGTDPLYDDDLSIRTTVLVRQEE